MGSQKHITEKELQEIIYESTMTYLKENECEESKIGQTLGKAAGKTKNFVKNAIDKTKEGAKEFKQAFDDETKDYKYTNEDPYEKKEVKENTIKLTEEDLSGMIMEAAKSYLVENGYDESKVGQTLGTLLGKTRNFFRRQRDKFKTGSKEFGQAYKDTSDSYRYVNKDPYQPYGGDQRRQSADDATFERSGNGRTPVDDPLKPDANDIAKKNAKINSEKAQDTLNSDETGKPKPKTKPLTKTQQTILALQNKLGRNFAKEMATITIANETCKENGTNLTSVLKTYNSQNQTK